MAEDKDESQEKTQEPSSRKLDKARQEGKVVSSKEMYSKYKIKDCIKHINLDNMHDYIGFNSFESLLCDEYSEIKDILDILRTNSNCSVSGSGGCLFSIFDEEVEAKNARELLPKKYQTYIVHSLNNI